MEINYIRNFSIIAHINHGKSTLADRFLELTHTVPENKMHPQYLDRMSLERERGITIKMQPVRMIYNFGGASYVLNLIDTPGHVDFAYEVSRALAAVEGTILLVDAQKGVQAQTLSHLRSAQKQGLKIIPAVNKIDLPQARTEIVKEELANLLGIAPDEILEVSAKTNQGVKELLEKVINNVPSPDKSSAEVASALVFDSFYDAFKGVVAYVRIFTSQFKRSDKIIFLRQQVKTDVVELGIFNPELKSQEELKAGSIGYIATGLKEPGLIKVGETISLLDDFNKGISKSLTGYEEPRPVVFASFYPKEASDDEQLRIALEKLKLNDAALTYEPENSSIFGRGFKIGFLGLLHLEIVSQRMAREFELELIATTPSVAYEIVDKNGNKSLIYSASGLPNYCQSIAEPWTELEIIMPPQYLSEVTQLVGKSRGIVGETRYLGGDYLLLKAQAPLSEIIVDFFDALKSVTSGFASMSYKPIDFRVADLVKLDVLVAEQKVDGLSKIVPKERAYYEGRRVVSKLKELLPPAQFSIILQAVIGSKIIARETIKALRKDVTGYLYGGDRTRKMKLLQKQKKGKKKLQKIGKIDVPTSVFLELLKK